MRADGFEGLRGGPDAVLAWVEIGEETQYSVAVCRPRGKRIEVGQIVSRVKACGASTFFERAEASEIEFPLPSVGREKFAEKFRCVLRVILQDKAKTRGFDFFGLGKSCDAVLRGTIGDIFVER